MKTFAMDLVNYCCLFLFLSTLLSNTHCKDARSVQESVQLQCPSCDRVQCYPRRAKRLKCKGGITRGVCNCCPICAKVEGEACGGYWHALGKCDAGLYCEYNVKDWDPHHWQSSLENIPEGICRGKCKLFNS